MTGPLSMPVRTAVQNGIATLLNDAYGFVPLSVRYMAAEKALKVVDLWISLGELPNPETPESGGTAP